MDSSKIHTAAAIAAASASAWFFLTAAECLRVKRERRKLGRSCWVQPYRKTRRTCEDVWSLLKEFELASEVENTKSYLLMDEECFQEILQFIENDITRQDTSLRKCITAKERLAVTLRFLATGECFKELNDKTKLSTSFLRTSILEVCEAIYKNMKGTYLKFPNSKEQWSKIADEFEFQCQFPLCLGALAAQHIAFTPSMQDAPLFYNSKGFHSIVLMAMADVNAKFTFIDLQCSGRLSNEEILNRSDLMTVLNQSNEFLPEPKTIVNNKTLPYVIVADNTFPLMKNVMTPFSDECIDGKLINYNTRVKRVRENIDRAFSLLVTNFRILKKQSKLKQEKTTKIVQCCCVLHNFLMEKSSWYLNNNSTNGLSTNNTSEEVQIEGNRSFQENPTNKEAEAIREVFVNYFEKGKTNY